MIDGSYFRPPIPLSDPTTTTFLSAPGTRNTVRHVGFFLGGPGRAGIPTRSPNTSALLPGYEMAWPDAHHPPLGRLWPAPAEASKMCAPNSNPSPPDLRLWEPSN